MTANALAGFGLIFGHFGLPRLGILGAAWAMNIGIFVETAAFAFFAFAHSSRRTFHAFDWRLRPAELLTLVRIGLPSGLQILADVLAWFLFVALVMGQFGNTAMAANTFMFRYMAVSFMPIFGIGTAVTALVGRYIGRGQPDLAEHRARLGFILAGAYVTLCATIYIFARGPLIGLFSTDPDVLRLGTTLMIFAAVYQLFDALYIIYYGALRGAGDTFVPALATAGLCWGITVLAGYLAARFLPQFGPSGPWVMATIYGIILGFFMYARWTRGHWRSLRLEQPANSTKVMDFPAID
jgi:MATE family multidrug resistance protein